MMNHYFLYSISLLVHLYFNVYVLNDYLIIHKHINHILDDLMEYSIL